MAAPFLGRTLCVALAVISLLFSHALAHSLQRFYTCPSLLDYFKTNALERVGPYGLGSSRNYGFGGFGAFPCYNGGFGGVASAIIGGKGGRGGDGGAGAVFGAAGQGGNGFTESATLAQAPSEPQVAGVDFSETNVQVAGVDEPDIVKTDGTNVYVVRGKKLFVLQSSSNGHSTRVLGQLTLPQHASEMLIEGDHLLVIARGYGKLGEDSVHVDNGFTGFGSLISRSSFFPIPRPQSTPLTIVYQIQVTNGSPRLLATLRMEGTYKSSREVGGVARIIMYFNPNSGFPWKYPSCSVSYGQAIEHNKKIIRDTKAEDWVPRFDLKTAGSDKFSTGLVSQCGNTYSPVVFSGFGLLTVATVSLSGSIKPSGGVSITSQAEDVYSTASSLYVTTTEYRWDFFGLESDFRSGSNFKSSIHKFALSNGGASYVASGEVSGSVLNQFSMHDFNGYFFIATTDGATWWTGRNPSSSKVTAFRAVKKSKSLVKTGEVGNLGLGERIFAVRYVKNTAYVVTFRRIDPLYIIDLSNPWHLRATGELKIPGYSAYLHPISSGRILGVGQDATPEGRTTGAKVSLFDVSDVKKPKELSSWTLPRSTSTAEWDHRAFLFWEPESVAVLPISTYYSASDRFVGSILLDITDTEIKERGRIMHQNKSEYRSRIERNLVLGGTKLWSLSYERMQLNDIRDLRKLSSVDLPRY
ncbi:hypothetical protein BWQ96_09095 [Gracilariopsis chorda]|uniref:Uncharacterized protein n=1 Tax=Gracilariopsis chorda TaxID=448386 RepID=A0A2V3IGI0_9FLOR|nr:hypothetical protein BWQ96_09095 [Gracilariopsis chorda]|eukprot:PXF41179.1 hypothetical protein BWQ96_09095 [Gracilariopsis chorda]